MAHNSICGELVILYKIVSVILQKYLFGDSGFEDTLHVAFSGYRFPVQNSFVDPAEIPLRGFAIHLLASLSGVLIIN